MKDLNKLLLEQLLPLHQTDELDARLKTLLPKSTKPQQLMIKMEIKRLMAPCLKRIDLRGKVAGECFPYELHGQTHWLDDVAINLYYRRLEIYQNKITLGLWEELQKTPNNYQELRKRPQSEKALKNQNETYPLCFGKRLTRSELRIQISSPVQAFLSNDMEVHGSTLDISSSGLRAKMPASFQYEKGDILTFFFPKLKEEFKLEGFSSGIQYQLISREMNHARDHFQRLSLQLITKTTVIKELIKKINEKSAKKAAIENEDKLFLLRTQCYEQIFLSQTPSLPLFFSDHELKFSLLTNENKDLWNYWHDERNLLVIHRLFSKERLNQLKYKEKKHIETLIYCFTHQHADKTYFFSAVPESLPPEIRTLFFDFGSRQSSWRILRLTMTKISRDNIKQIQSFISKQKDKITPLSHVAFLQDLTLKQTREDFNSKINTSHSLKSFKPYVHPRAQVSTAKSITTLLLPQRKETRYKHKTATTLSHPIKGDFSAQSIDFSPHGLSLSLSTGFPGLRAQEINVTFSDLMRRDPKAPLQEVPYNVIRISENGKELKLSLSKNKNSEIRSQYLNRLIKHNQKRLKIDDEDIPEASFLHALQQLLLTRLVSIPYFLCFKNDEFQLSAIAKNDAPFGFEALLQIDKNEKKMSLRHFFDEDITTLLHPILKKIKRENKIQHEFYFAVEIKEDQINKITQKKLEMFSSLNERIDFIKKARENGQFFAIRNRMQPLKEIEQALHLEDFLSLHNISASKLKRIEIEMSKLCIYGELSDITDEVLLRLNIS